MRATPEEMHDDASEAIVTALQRTGLTAWRVPEGGDQGVDVLLRTPDGGVIAIQAKALSLADRGRVMSQIERSATEDRASSTGRLVVLVADALPKSAKETLKDHGWGYLDRTGELLLRSNQVFVHDTTIGPLERGRPESTMAIRGLVGLSTALWILMHPRQKLVIRELARNLDYSSSSVHAAVHRLRDHALIDKVEEPLIPELFNALSAVWKPERIAVSREPYPGEDEALGINLAGEGPGWVLGGDVAAAAWGARIVVSSGSPPDFYVPNAAITRKAIRHLGGATVESRGATVATAPSPLVTAERRYPGSERTPWLHWQPAHPVVVALDLAQDPSRGREILDEWTPEGIDRVW